MLKKYFVVALLTLCLAVTLFSLIPIGGSQAPAPSNSRMAIAGELGMYDYDPWCDVNDDDIIDIADMSIEVDKFLTTGDTTKNVTITRHANKLAYSATLQPISAHDYFVTPDISIEEYSKITVCIYTTASSNRYWLGTSHWGGYLFYVDDVTNFGTYLVKTYDVPNEAIRVIIYNGDASQSVVSVDIYLIP
jgi:hypothetical protein